MGDDVVGQNDVVAFGEVRLVFKRHRSHKQRRKMPSVENSVLCATLDPLSEGTARSTLGTLAAFFRLRPLRGAQDYARQWP